MSVEMTEDIHNELVSEFHELTTSLVSDMWDGVDDIKAKLIEAGTIGQEVSDKVNNLTVSAAAGLCAAVIQGIVVESSYPVVIDDMQRRIELFLESTTKDEEE